jgi:hypothetical protein
MVAKSITGNKAEEFKGHWTVLSAAKKADSRHLLLRFGGNAGRKEHDALNVPPMTFFSHRLIYLCVARCRAAI